MAWRTLSTKQSGLVELPSTNSLMSSVWRYHCQKSLSFGTSTRGTAVPMTVFRQGIVIVLLEVNGVDLSKKISLASSLQCGGMMSAQHSNVRVYAVR